MNTRSSFSKSALAATSLALLSLLEGASAGLPRQCFFVMDVQGQDFGEGDWELVSDLPILMKMYEPGMQVDSVRVDKD